MSSPRFRKAAVATLSSYPVRRLPNLSVGADHCVMAVHAGHKKIDHFNQSYPPHGSVNRTTVARHRRQVPSAIGDIYSHEELSLHFGLRCRIA